MSLEVKRDDNSICPSEAPLPGFSRQGNPWGDLHPDFGGDPACHEVSSRAWPGGRVCTQRPPQWGSGSVALPAPRGVLTLPGPGARGWGWVFAAILNDYKPRGLKPESRCLTVWGPGVGSRFTGLVPRRLPEGPSVPLLASRGRWQLLEGKPIPPVSAAVIPCPPPPCICACLSSLGNKLLRFEATQSRVTCSRTTHCGTVQAPLHLLVPVALSVVSFHKWKSWYQWNQVHQV